MSSNPQVYQRHGQGQQEGSVIFVVVGRRTKPWQLECAGRVSDTHKVLSRSSRTCIRRCISRKYPIYESHGNSLAIKHHVRPFEFVMGMCWIFVRRLPPFTNKRGAYSWDAVSCCEKRSIIKYMIMCVALAPKPLARRTWHLLLFSTCGLDEDKKNSSQNLPGQQYKYQIGIYSP